MAELVASSRLVPPKRVARRRNLSRRSAWRGGGTCPAEARGAEGGTCPAEARGAEAEPVPPKRVARRAEPVPPKRVARRRNLSRRSAWRGGGTCPAEARGAEADVRLRSATEGRLLVAEGSHRIDRHGSPCRHQHRDERDGGEETGHREVQPPVRRRDAKEHRLQRSSDRPCEHEPGDERR